MTIRIDTENAEVGNVDEQACPRGKNWCGRDYGSVIVRAVGLPLCEKNVSLAEGLRVALPSDSRGSDRGKEMTAGAALTARQGVSEGLRSKNLETYDRVSAGSKTHAGQSERLIPELNGECPLKWSLKL